MSQQKHHLRAYSQPAFLICAAVLAITGAGLSLAIKGLGVYLKKEPLPLKKSLDLLDEAKLFPYKVLSKGKIENQDVIKSLGTEDYIQWVLEDSEVPVDSPVCRVMLFITYYELPDRVPHVPEECYTGGGFQRLATDNVEFEINIPGFRRNLGGKYLVFGSPQMDFLEGSKKFPVVYLFRVNGEYAANRDEARMALNKNLFGKYAYFCKIELAYHQSPAAPGKEQTVRASEKLLAVILPILETEHWPDLKR
jgi:hypothetical protein